jgi:hypothetical protein
VKLKIVIAFFVIGIGLSLPGGIIAGNSIYNVITYSIISSIVLAGLVFGLLTFLETKVPEFTDFLNNVNTGNFSENTDADTAEGSSEQKQADSKTEQQHTDFHSTESSGEKSSLGEPPPPPPKNEKPKNGKFGDHIMIDNIPIKNEPKLMAEAIRTIMAQDDMPNNTNKPK